MRWPTRLLAVLAFIPVLLLAMAGPAAAHGGDVKLSAAGDGAGGVTIQAAYTDGHPVDDVALRLVLTATADGARSVGPLQLTPTGEGRGFYTTGNILSPGRWQVTLTAPEPTPARLVITVEAKAAQTPRPGSPAAAPSSTSDGYPWLWWIVTAAVVIGAVAAGWVIWRRRATSA